MKTTLESIQQEIQDNFEKSDLLSSLILANVEVVAQEVVSTFPKDQQYLDSAKVGCLEAWVNRLCGLLRQADRDYLLNLMQKRVDSFKERE